MAELSKSPTDIVNAIKSIVSSGMTFSTNFNLSDLEKALKTIDNYESLNANIKDFDLKMKFYFTTLSFSQDLVSNGPSKINELIKTGKGLNPTDDFTGLNKRKIASVSKSLKTSIENLNESLKNIESLSTTVKNLGF